MTTTNHDQPLIDPEVLRQNLAVDLALLKELLRLDPFLETRRYALAGPFESPSSLLDNDAKESQSKNGGVFSSVQISQ